MSEILGQFLSGIADAIREKTGETGTIKPVMFAEKIRSVGGSGGIIVENKVWSDSTETSDPASGSLTGNGIIRYVTFKNHDGSVEYGKKSVIAGEDCIDPVASGLMDIPTRESTAQYRYTFSGGWATTPDGGIDDNALKAVAGDRTVYANFIAALRSYTITFLDDDGSVLETRTLTYGSTPVYTPDKEGFSFVDWTPALAVVTGNATYTAQWEALTGLRFVSRATGVPNLGDIKGSTLTVKNNGTQVVVVDNNTKLQALPVYNTTTPEATAGTIATGLSCYRSDGHFNRTYSKLYSRSYISNAYHLITDNLNGTTDNISGGFSRIATSPSSDLVFVVTGSNNAYSLNKGQTSFTRVANLGKSVPSHMKITRDDEYAVCADSEIKVYRISDGTLVQTFEGTGSSFDVNNLSVSADGKRLAVCWRTAPYVAVYSLETLEKICDFSDIVNADSHSAFVGDILLVATGTTVRAYTIVDGVPEEYFQIPAYSGGSVKRISTSLNGNYAVIYDGSSFELWSKV